MLDDGSFAHAVATLTAADPDLARVVARRGPPPFWRREPGFGTLIHIVLEQQVSLASARAAFDRLTPATLDLTELRSNEVRAHQKAVSRRARTMIQDIEAAEAARGLPEQSTS